MRFCYNGVHIRAMRGKRGMPMGRKSVTVLDVRSSEVSVIVGERGVNHTIVFNASHTESYDGFDDGGVLFDAAKFGEAIDRCIDSVQRMTNERIKKLYIGVPGYYALALPVGQRTSFPKRRKISEREIDELFKRGQNAVEGYRFVRASSMIYITADKRRTVDPLGLATTSLDAQLSYNYCKEAFAAMLEPVLAKYKLDVCYLPTQLAMATYLIPSETRDEHAILLDSDFLTSTIGVVLGGGIMDQESYWTGTAQIALSLSDAFGVPFGLAKSLLSRANLYAKEGSDTREYLYRGTAYEIATKDLNEAFRSGLDDLCESIGTFLEYDSGKELDCKPLYITGEGVPQIRGATEHIARRLNRTCEIVAPNLPYYNKPAMSSRISLVDMACEDREKDGFFRHIFN